MVLLIRLFISLKKEFVSYRTGDATAANVFFLRIAFVGFGVGAMGDSSNEDSFNKAIFFFAGLGALLACFRLGAALALGAFLAGAFFVFFGFVVTFFFWLVKDEAFSLSGLRALNSQNGRGAWRLRVLRRVADIFEFTIRQQQIRNKKYAMEYSLGKTCAPTLCLNNNGV